MAQSANRRTYPRRLRRVQVRFRREQEERPRNGFTKNLSVTGAFITTPDPANRGERLHLELLEAGHQVRVEAVVVHAHRMPPELRRFAESAMGVRFLDLEELVGPLLPAAAQQATEWPDETGATELTPAGASEAPAVGAPAGPEQAATAPRRPPGPALRSPEHQVYPLSFENPADLVALYRRDVVNGGLFVSTSRPAALDSAVIVEIHLPEGRPAVRAEARVVQVVEPRAIGVGRTAGGMGLELRDPDRLIRDLGPVIAALEGER